MKNMEKFKNLKKEIESNLGDYALDFVDNHSADDNDYISDAISEFADYNTSVYYSDHREFYHKNQDLCDNALIEYGYSLDDMIKEGCKLDDIICKAGAIGEYSKIENEIYSEIDNILKLLLINYIIENEIEIDAEVLENVEYYQMNRFSDLLDLLEDEEEEEEEEE